MSDQDLFNFVLLKITEQGEPSYEDDKCLYRMIKSDGTVLKCGAGQLIPDEVYDPSMEGKAAFVISYFQLNLRKQIHLISDMQSAHDRAARNCLNFEDKPFIELFNDYMKEVAKNYDLKLKETA
jgi:hypothetical protein